MHSVPHQTDARNAAASPPTVQFAPGDTPMPDRPMFGSARYAAGRIEVFISLPVAAAELRPWPGGPPSVPLTESPSGRRPTHGPGFASVDWFGTVYHFSPKQRAVVAALWRAWEDGAVFVAGKALLELADSDGCRVRDLFRGHPAWGELIVPAVYNGGPPGSYRWPPTRPKSRNRPATRSNPEWPPDRPVRPLCALTPRNRPGQPAGAVQIAQPDDSPGRRIRKVREYGTKKRKS